MEKFSSIKDIKIIKENKTQKRNKNYGFIYFSNKYEAFQAIKEMEGAMIGKKKVKTNIGVSRGVSSESHQKYC